MKHRGLICLAALSVIGGGRLSFAATTPTDPVLHAPIIDQLVGGLQVTNFRTTGNLFAYPLQSPPVVGFRPIVAVTLTDQQGPDDLNFGAIPNNQRIGSLMPAGQPEYTYLATLDSGGQSHILAADVAAMIDFEASNRAGQFSIGVTGASGSEDLLVSDPIGVWVAGVDRITNTTTLQAPANAYKGQFHSSVLTAEAGSVLPSIIGVPMFAHYAVNIRNSQTRRLATPEGAIRSPAIEFVSPGSGAQFQFRLELDLRDPSNSATAPPSFFPSFTDFDDFSNDPSTPTFWTFPIANANLSHTGGSVNQQEFLFDTGAQVTVVSEATADAIGFDVGTDTPDFFVDVLGVGGVTQVPGFFVNQLELPVTGGSAIYQDVPVIVLNIADPRDGVGFVPGIIGMNLFNDRDLMVDMNPSNPHVRFSAPITPQWNKNADGVWLPDGNWDLGTPDGTDVPANFLGAITAARTVTVDGDYTIGSMKFDNANSYTLAGSGRLTFDALGRPSTIAVEQGAHTVASPLTFAAEMSINIATSSTLTLSGDHASPLASVTKSGAGQLRLSNARFESLAITGGSVQILANGGNASTSKLDSLTIAAGSTLDLTSSKLIIDYTGAIPPANVRLDIIAGRLTSSLMTPNKALGYAVTSDLGLTSFGGQSVDSTSVLVWLTFKGDTNLSGNVDFDDLLALAQNYGSTSSTWTKGDFDYNGATNFDDLLALAQNYGANGLSETQLDALGESFASDWTLAMSLVPEPVSLSALATIGTLVLPRRRVRRYH